MWLNRQFPADLVTFTEEILDGKLYFLCSATIFLKNVSGLRAMYNLAEGNVYNLQSLGVPSDAYGKFACSFVNQKNSA